MKPPLYKLCLCFTFLLAGHETLSQSNDTIVNLRVKPFLKLGGFIYFSDPGSFSSHLEFEQALKRAKYLTIGGRIDYYSSPRHNTSDVYLGAQLKFYPTYWRLKFRIVEFSLVSSL